MNTRIRRIAGIAGVVLTAGCSHVQHSGIAASLRPPAAAKGVQWLTDWDSARAAAQSEHKPIMVDLYTDWCTWCKKLDSDVYPDSRVGAASTQFIPVRLDGEKNGAMLATKFAVPSYPTVLFVDSDGVLVGMISGFVPAGEFASEVNQVAEDYREYPGLRSKFSENPGDFDSAVKLARIDIDRRNTKDAVAVADSMVRHGGGTKAAPVYNLIAGEYYEAGGVDDAIGVFKKSLSIATSTKDRVGAHLGLVKCYATEKNMAGMTEHLKAIDEIPGVPPNIKSHVAKILKEMRDLSGQGG